MCSGSRVDASTCLPNTTSTRLLQICRNLWKTNPIFEHTLYILSNYLTSIPTDSDSNPPKPNQVSSPGMPSNFHLNFIPGSLDEINFGLGKTTKLRSFSGPKKKRVEASRKIETEEKEKKGLSAALLLFGFAGSQYFPPPSLSSHAKKMEILILISFLLSVPNKRALEWSADGPFSFLINSPYKIKIQKVNYSYNNTTIVIGWIYICLLLFIDMRSNMNITY